MAMGCGKAFSCVPVLEPSASQLAAEEPLKSSLTQATCKTASGSESCFGSPSALFSAMGGACDAKHQLAAFLGERGAFS